MLIRFTVENFKSIYKRLDLSFVAEPLKQHEETNLILTEYAKISLLKALSIYGANASGKTNLIKAIAFIKDLVKDSILNLPNKRIPVETFKLLDKAQRQPSWFEIDFIVNENRYRYGFKVTQERVEKEYLYLVLKTTEKLLFHRDRDEIEFGTSFNEGYGKEKFVKQTSLFIAILAQLKGSISLQIVQWLENVLIITDYNYVSFTGFTANLINQHKHSEFVLKILKTGGLDFEDLVIKPIGNNENQYQFLSYEAGEIIRKNYPEQFQVYFRHNVYDIEENKTVGSIDFNLREESGGTQKFFAIAGPIINSLINGYPIFIDELDARLHYKLVEFLVQLYCSQKFNPFGGQIVYSNHMLELMDRQLLRRDQILLLSKARHQTSITSLLKQGARSDKSFKRDYLNKEFGGIPDIEFNQLDLFDKYF